MSGPSAVLKVVLLVSLVALLSGCATGQDRTEEPTAGREMPFQLTGDVSAVDVEDVDFDVDASIGPDGVDVDSAGSVTVHLTVTVESIDPQSAELCGLEEGESAIVIVSEETDLQFDRPLTELDTIRDESITASGTARELMAPETAQADAGGTCALDAATLALSEEPQGAATASPTP